MNLLSRPRTTQGEPRHKSVSSGWRSSNPDREAPLNARRWTSPMRFLSNGCACARAIGLGRREDARRAAGDPMTGSSGVRGCQCADRGADQRRRPRSNPVRPARPTDLEFPAPEPVQGEKWRSGRIVPPRTPPHRRRNRAITRKPSSTSEVPTRTILPQRHSRGPTDRRSLRRTARVSPRTRLTRNHETGRGAHANGRRATARTSARRAHARRAGRILRTLRRVWSRRRRRPARSPTGSSWR